MAELEEPVWISLCAFMEEDRANWRSAQKSKLKEKSTQAKAGTQKSHRESLAKEGKASKKTPKVYEVPAFAAVKVTMFSLFC